MPFVIHVIDGWKVWALRLAITLVVTAGVAWGVSFFVSDYIVRAALRGYDKNVETLNQNVSNLTSTAERLSGRQDDTSDKFLDRIAEFQESNTLLERRILTRFDNLLDKMESANVELGRLASSLGATVETIQALDERQRNFEHLVISTILQTTDPASYRSDWNKNWKLAPDLAVEFGLEQKKLSQFLASYKEPR